MTYIAKPRLHHPSLVKNKAGFTRRDYEGAVSTLCAGCGHDSISAAVIQACYDLDLPPHRIAKLSGRMGPDADDHAVSPAESLRAHLAITRRAHA